eukprot:TRINITY_DN12323_c0_g2_i1.p1 TRINITY_DN12323_c0_g2~~TRINITY_DN12323_c0_g2_i1.p1  ORF type:complete len:198 (+),score=71.43 TRINITY_DN12323_c0_g2_i1:394-987(+)
MEGKDKQIAFFIRQTEAAKRQLATSQNRVKELTGNFVPELTKQLEGKIKEIEMVKEMLKSSKIELNGKDRELKRLKAKLKVTEQSNRESQGKIKVIKKADSKPAVKSIQAFKPSDFGTFSKIKADSMNEEADACLKPGRNLFFHQNYADASAIPELGDLKDLELEASMDKLKTIPNLNFNVPEVEELHLPPVPGTEQ